MSTISEILSVARALLEKPHRWTKDAYAADKNGNPIDARSEQAQCFCIMGAVQRQCDLTTEDGRATYFQALKAIAAHLPPKSTISGFNDNASHDAVLRLLDTAVSA